MSDQEIPGETTETIDPLVGLTLGGRFHLERLVSRGGMGKVYKATQKPLERTVALKVLDVTDDASGQFRRRFFMEASLCAKLTHPHTVRIFDYGATDDGIFYIAMEYIDGTTLHDMLHHEAPLDPIRATVLFRRICGALAEAHGAGIVHRDLKPANILLSRHGEDREFPTVIDFGLVKELGKESELSRTGHVLGSPLYMAPEQIEGLAVDGRTDVYAIGLILYYALCGTTAFRRGNPMAVLMAQVNKIPPKFAEANPDVEVPEPLEWVVRRCIAKEPADRFASMHELLRALKACEMLLRGEIPGPLSLELEDGRVVLPAGVDISEEYRLPSSSIPRSTTPRSQEVKVDNPTDSTLFPVVKGAKVPEPQPTNQFRMVLASSVLALGLLVGLLGVIGGIGYVLWDREPVPDPGVVSTEQALAVQLVSDPEGADVEREGAFVGRTPLSLSASDEAYTVTVTADGYEPRTVRIDGSQSSLRVSLTALAPAKASASGTAEASGAVPSDEEPTEQPGMDEVDETDPSTETEPAPAPRRNLGDIRDPWGNP